MGDSDTAEELLQQTASQEERDDLEVIGIQDDDMVVFKVITVDDVDQYKCTACGKKYKAKNSVRTHITKVHKKKTEKESTAVDKEKEDAPFDMRRLDRWRSTSTPQEGGELGDARVRGLEEDFNLEEEENAEKDPEQDAEEDPDKDESLETLKLELVEVNAKLNSMKEQYEILEVKAKEEAATRESIEQAMETSKQLLDMSQAKVNSLEMDIEDKKETITGFEDVFKQMEAKIKVIESAAEKNLNPIAENTIKTLKDEVKAKKKEADDANKKANDTMKKLKDETNARSVAQAEVIRITKTSESQAKVIELLEKAQGCRAGEKRRRSRSKSEEQRYTRRKRSRSPVTRGRAERSPAGRSRNERTGRRSTSMERRRSKELCRDYTKPGGCSYGSRCKYFHPKEKEVQGLPRSGSRGRRSPASNISREDRGIRSTKEDSGRRTMSRSKEPRGRRSRSKEQR